MLLVLELNVVWNLLSNDHSVNMSSNLIGELIDSSQQGLGRDRLTGHGESISESLNTVYFGIWYTGVLPPSVWCSGLVRGMNSK